MWYLPVIDHLKRVFSNPMDAELVRWHSEKRRENDEEIRHPADGTQWNFFDLQYPKFAAESKIFLIFSIHLVKTRPCTTHGRLSSWCTTFQHGYITKESILYFLILSKVQSKLASILMCSWNHSWKIWWSSRIKESVCGISISRSISR
jgi:hypothetical protein